MAEKNTEETQPEQLAFPDPNEFDNYDEVDSYEANGELPDDSYNASAASDDEVDDDEGCGCA